MTVTSMSNPFSPESPTELVNICSGVVADEETTKDLQNAYVKGDERLEQYFETRLLCEEPDIFSRIEKMKLKSFNTMAKSTTTRTSSSSVVTVKNDCRFWARLLLIARNRDINLEHVFTYSLRPYPRALATDSGCLVKTVKSKLLHVLEQEAEVPLIEQIPSNSATIVDGMALLQMLKARNIPETFGQLADVVLKNVIDIAVYNKSQRVDFVTDRYPTVSTKNAERLHRAASGTYVVSILSDQQKVPKQWKKFMSVGSNKERLVEFLVQQWRNVRCSALQSTQLFVTNKEKCYHYYPNADAVTVEEVPELACDHEEADTKMFVHAQHAAAASDVVVIKSPDTDVFVIALACQATIPARLIFDTGTANNRRRIDISEVARFFGPRWCRAIIGFHIFTGEINLQFIITVCCIRIHLTCPLLVYSVYR
jgi:hypothetical protein